MPTCIYIAWTTVTRCHQACRASFSPHPVMDETATVPSNQRTVDRDGSALGKTPSLLGPPFALPPAAMPHFRVHGLTRRTSQQLCVQTASSLFIHHLATPRHYSRRTTRPTSRGHLSADKQHHRGATRRGSRPGTGGSLLSAPPEYPTLHCTRMILLVCRSPAWTC